MSAKITLFGELECINISSTLSNVKLELKIGSIC